MWRLSEVKGRPARTRPRPHSAFPASTGHWPCDPWSATGRRQLYFGNRPHPAVDRLMDAWRCAWRWQPMLPARFDFAQSTPPLSAPDVYLHILDSGNRFDLHGIARGIARGIAGGIARGIYAGGLTGGSLQVEAILKRIHVARAFTCYQTEALLSGVALPLSPTSPACSDPGAGFAHPIRR